jgi:hypothetical protein
MDFFFQEYLSFVIRVLPAFILFWFVIKILRRLTIKNHIQSITKLPDDKKDSIIRLYGNIISMDITGLRISIFSLLIILSAFAILLVLSLSDIDVFRLALLGGILFVLWLVHSLEDINYRRKILKAIEKPGERVTS